MSPLRNLDLAESLDRPSLAPRPRPSYMGLGASLYIPATRHDLAGILNQDKLPGLRSVVICTEDAVAPRDLPAALENVRRNLSELRPANIFRFVRPRTPEVLDLLLRMDGIQRIDGAVLPKIDERNFPRYAEIAARQPGLCLMPTIETDIAFARPRLDLLRERLRETANPILCLRIGGNDLLQLLGLKRPKEVTLYETPLRALVNDLILTFRPAGFELSAPVYEHLDNPRVLQQEVLLDLIHGLWTKTAIHPTQIPVIEDLYRVPEADLELARAVLAEDAPAVFQVQGQMVEPSTHAGWARRILERALMYGTQSANAN